MSDSVEKKGLDFSRSILNRCSKDSKYLTDGDMSLLLVNCAVSLVCCYEEYAKFLRNHLDVLIEDVKVRNLTNLEKQDET